MKRRYKNDVAQKQWEIAIEKSYPLSISNGGIGGAIADAFNAGYTGKKGGIYRYSNRHSAGNIFYQAGKYKRKIDNIGQPVTV